MISRRKFFKWTVRTALTGLVVTSVTVMGFLGLETVYPFAVARDVLTDGTRIVVVEGMAHVASPRFYDGVRADIAHEKSLGAAYLYEGVHDDASPPSKVADDKPVGDNKKAEITAIMMGSTVRPDVDINRLYGLLSQASGLEVQPQETFMDIPGGPDVNADMSTSELLARLQAARTAQVRKRALPTSDAGNATSNKIVSSQVDDKIDLDQLEKSIQALSARERTVLAFLMKGVISSVLRVSEWFDIVPYAEEIDGARTHLLATVIQGRAEKRTVVTYGMRHLDGLLTDLQAMDSRWVRVERTWHPTFR